MKERYTGKIRIVQAANGKCYFSVLGRSGVSIMSSRRYASLPGCKQGIAAVRRLLKNPKILGPS